VVDNFFPTKKVAEIFGGQHLKPKIEELETKELIPHSSKKRYGALPKSGWTLEQLPLIGEQIGFFPKFDKPVAFSVFTTKGGVLKSTLALNLARVAALHNHKTCVVGLDIQGDITNALGFESEFDDDEGLEMLIEKVNATKGLSDYFNGNVRLQDTIVETNLPTLHLIPETPELVAMNDSLANINRREYWIREKVIAPLKENYDLIIMDCSPNWNKLTTNALVACDVLLSPLECKINNFRNFKVFRQFLNEFKSEMHLDFENIFVPTRYSLNRKLSLEIKKWYEGNLSGCSPIGIRESVMGEESTALYKSIVEHVPGKNLGKEMANLLEEVHSRTSEFLSKQIQAPNWNNTVSPELHEVRV